MERRDFLKGVATAVGSSLLPGPVSAGPAPKRSSTIKYINPNVPNLEPPVYGGRRYEARVPDTLDMAARAALAVNGLTGPTDPDADYEIYFGAVFDNNPVYIYHDWNDLVQFKFHESLPLMRLASGSHLNEEVDQRWMEILVQMQGPDGLLYYPWVGRPWARRGISKNIFGEMPAGDQYEEVFANGKLLGAIALYYKLTGDKIWLRVGERLVDGLSKQAVHRGDYAYYTTGVFGVNQVSDPKVAQESIDPWKNMTFGWITMGLGQFYQHTGYEPALKLSGELARYTRYHGHIFEADGRFVGVGMHFHGHLYVLLGMLEYATAAGDREMVEFVRKGFEFGFPHMWRTVGYVPEWINPEKYQTSETCGVADMVALGLKLSRTGAGDYWDDVDRWTRNQFVENQLTSSAWVPRMVKDLPVDRKPLVEPGVTTERVAERCVGGFAGWPSANDWQGRKSSIMHCCTGNGTRTIYYVWENIVSQEGGKLKVNLLLNRASSWADIDSFIPFEGRVDVRVKQASELSVRIPDWVKVQEARCAVNGSERSLSWEGRYAVVGRVKPQDKVTLKFPISERKEVIRIYGQDYTLTLKGHDVVDVDPQGKNCPLYQRSQYRRNAAVFKTVKRFVPDKLVDW